MTNDVPTWLAQLGLEEYVTLFQDNKISFEILPELTESDLEKLGVLLGHRKQLMKAIRSLVAVESQESSLLTSTTTTVSPGPHSDRTKPERRQLTVMFCDMVGSTALSEKVDPEVMREIVTSYRDTCEQVIARNQGKTARYVGDGILVYFGYPEAQEDDPERAVRTGLQIAKELAAQVYESIPESEQRIAVRIGIATGNVVAGDMIGKDTEEHAAVVGEAPHLAERLMKIAEPGTVVVSDSTQRLVAGLFDCLEIGDHSLKGFAHKIHAWQVIQESAVKSRSQALYAKTKLTELVGRDEEVELLLRRWRNVQSGEGHVVLLSGEPGIGKSRLAWTLRSELKRFHQPHSVQRYYCSPRYQNTALYPIIAQLSRTAGIDSLDTPDQKLDKLGAMLARGTDDVTETTRILSDLLSIPSEDRYPPLGLSLQGHKKKTLDVLEEQLVEIARRHPVLVIFEDLHWSDPTTRELLDRVIYRVSNLSMLMLVTFRPEFVAPWSGEHYVTTFIMKRLSPSDSERFIENLSGDKSLPSPVTERIINETDGNPLYIEEVYKTIVAGGFLRDEGDRYTLKDPSATFLVPSSLTDSLMARLDRLGSAKPIAQVAAALGRQFPHNLIAAVSPLGDAELQQALDRLVQSEIIYKRGTEPPDTVYIFKHALLQDAAHSSLLHSESKELHARIARILEDKYPGRVEREPELMAQHYTLAGLDDQALDYWQRAGERAIQQLGYTAPEVEANYSRARNLCEKRGYGSKRLKSKIFPAIRGLWVYHFIRADLNDAHELGDQLLELSNDLTKDEGLPEDKRHTGYLIEAHRSLGMTEFYQGKFNSSHFHLQQGTKYYDPDQHRSHIYSYGVDPGIVCMSYLAFVLWFLGYPDQALRQSEAALSVTRELDHPFSQANSLAFAAYLRQHVRDAKATKKFAEDVIAISSKHGFPFWENQQKILQGWALAELGENADGIALMREGLESYHLMGSRLACSWFLGMFAEITAKSGLQVESLKALHEALEIIESTGERFHLAEIYRLRGELTLIHQGLDAAADVEACYRRSLEIARAQQAVSWELRTAIGLAGLLRDLGRQEDAWASLCPVFDKFKEGFKTADLKVARILLDDLKRN